ncbi:MAG: class II fructose-bisphosphate aldolase [Oscillospiraceae bacterium]|nr:class II fructose-bisphosphate aldolase [Oscillospiraceae bacterium]
MQQESLHSLLVRADEGGFAIPAFNYSDIWDLLAIVKAAEEERAPVMIASNPLVVEAISVEVCGAIGREIMGKASVPIIHHLDHSFSADLCKAAIDHGYPSVMIDASQQDLEHNIRTVREVVEYARPYNVHVEAEIGKIKGMNVEGVYVGGDFLVDVADAVKLVEETGVDSLAVGIGTAHGFYEGKPEINFKRLAEVNEAVKVPLVLHGGTGIPENDISMAIKNGINKINVGTIIHCTYMNSMRAELNRVGDNPYTLDVVKTVTEDIKAVVKRWIRVCMTNGKA